MVVSMADRNEDGTVAEILDREFSSLRASGTENIETIAEQARFLGLDRTAFSRFRNGRRPLTRVRAEQIAAKLRASEGELIGELAHELVDARRGLTADQVAVRDWFRGRELHKALLLVEFREAPALRPDGENVEILVEAVAEAIVSGLNYGMLFPFNPDSRSGSFPIPVRNYLGEVKIALFSTYREILKEVLHQVGENCSNRKTLRNELEQATRRLKLYGLKAASTTAREESCCPAIGYRLFYVLYPESPTGPRRAERWEWVSSGGATQMIQKDSSVAELEAIAVRFFPIVEFWKDKEEDTHRLPATTAEMSDFANELEEQKSYQTSLELCEPQWEVIEKTAVVLAMVEAAASDKT